MSHTERIIGDPKTVSRRDFVKGAVTVVVSLIAASAIGGFAISAIDKAKAYVANRMGGLRAQDAGMALRTSHANPEVISLYEDFLSPGQVLPAQTELSHRLLHTVYGADVPAHVQELKSTPLSVAMEETEHFMRELQEKAQQAASAEAPAADAKTEPAAEAPKAN